MTKKEIAKISDITIEYRPRRRSSFPMCSGHDVAYYSFNNWPELAVRERMYIYYLDNQNYVTGRYEVAVGALTQCIVEPRNVFQAAILANASRLIMVHNHPSGDVLPSPADRATTQRIKEAGEILGITLLDHLIITHEAEKWYSFADHNLI